MRLNDGKRLEKLKVMVLELKCNLGGSQLKLRLRLDKGLGKRLDREKVEVLRRLFQKSDMKQERGSK